LQGWQTEATISLKGVKPKEKMVVHEEEREKLGVQNVWKARPTFLSGARVKGEEEGGRRDTGGTRKEANARWGDRAFVTRKKQTKNELLVFKKLPEVVFRGKTMWPTRGHGTQVFKNVGEKRNKGGGGEGVFGGQQWGGDRGKKKEDMAEDADEGGTKD